MKYRLTLAVLLSFIAGATVAISVPRLVGAGANHWLFPVDYRETARVTSPDGTVGAVMEESNCGAPCSVVYSVSIVPRSHPAPRDSVQQVFIGDDLINAQIRWSEPHLVDIGYDRALIDAFHNVAYPFGRPGNPDTWQYAVEIRLAPSSTRSSYLKDSNGAQPLTVK
jgi:hypothetical protein